ncbi:MAG: PKD domain-containing protein [Desulfobulbaceae bacterium]|nr:PKD domain-containing protein [Desulfobulbaceae bacterium]
MRELHVEVSYAGQAVSYNLYKNDIFVCNRSRDTELVCIVELDATPMDFVLTAVDEKGMESMPSAPFTLEPLPQANFVAKVGLGTEPLSVHFDASTSSEAVGGIVRYAWDFGDGRSGTGQYIDHTFAVAGSYTVRLTVVNDAGVVNEKAILMTLGKANSLQAITYRWEYSVATPGLAGFRLYMNGARICETANPAARTLTCLVPKSDGEKSFYLTAIVAGAKESSLSNRINFAP